MRNLFLLIILFSLISCDEKNGTNGSTNPLPASTLLWVAAFTAQNGSTISGQVEIWKNDSTGNERIVILNNFFVSGITGTIQFWLTDNTGADNLLISTKKMIVDSLISDYSGGHIFNIPSGAHSSNYSYIVAYHRQSASHIGKAHLLLPEPPGSGSNKLP